MSKRVIFKYSNTELTKLEEDETSCVSTVNSIFNLELFPYHLADISGAIKDLLRDKITTFCKRLDGILLGYKNLTLLTPQGAIIADSCYIHVSVEGDFYVFRPKVKSILTGIVNKVSKNHINCLVHKVFNISVPIPDHDNEDWIGFAVDIGQEVKLLVTKMQLNARLPYIRASLISSTPMDKKNSKIISNDADDESCNKKGKKKSSKKNKPQNNLVFGENETLEFATPKERKKRNSKLDEKDQENIEVNSLADFTTPVVKKEKKSKRISDLDNPEENNYCKKRANKVSDKVKEELESELDEKKIKRKRKSNTSINSVKDVVDSIMPKNNRSLKNKQRESTTSELDSEYDKKKKKKKSDNVNELNLNINKNKRSSKDKRQSITSEFESEYVEKKKKTKKSDKVVDSFNKKNKHYSELEPEDDGKKKPEKVKDVVEAFIKKKNSRYSQESDLELGSDKEKFEKLNDVVESFINKKNKQTSEKETKKMKQKRRSSDKHIESRIADAPEEQNQRNKPQKNENGKLGTIFTPPLPVKSMANDEDRVNKKKRLSTHKQIIWDKNESLNLFDSDLEKILKREKKESADDSDFGVAKITALNEEDTISKYGKRKNDSLSDFEEPAPKKVKRKSK